MSKTDSDKLEPFQLRALELNKAGGQGTQTEKQSESARLGDRKQPDPLDRNPC